jgi:hypothetical protein
LTYADVTGIRGKQRQKLHRQKTKVFPTIATAKTILAKIKKINHSRQKPASKASKVSNVETAPPAGTITYNSKPPTGSSPIQAPPTHTDRSQKSNRQHEGAARRAQAPSRRSPRRHRGNYAPTLNVPEFVDYCALHGTAMYPDTGMIAGYKALSKSSDGHLWKASNTEEIGRMCQGLGPNSSMPTGTNTLFFIDRHQIPKNKKPTYA